MLDHSQMNNIQRELSQSANRMEEPIVQQNIAGNAPLENQEAQHENAGAATLANIENQIAAIINDTQRMANFQRVISCAKLYSQAISLEEKNNSLFAIRDSAANYLIQRKSSSNQERKNLCERLIRDIDDYARQNNMVARHDVTYLVDRYATYDEIDNEIMLAHSLVSDTPMTEVTSERRESCRKKLEEVKAARSMMGDIEKWRSQKTQFLKDKGSELGLHQSVNEYFEHVCADAVLWYGRANNLKDEAMTTTLSRLKSDEDSGQLALNIKSRQIESILMDILTWNMEDFTFGRTDDFLHRKNMGESEKEHFMKLYSKLQVAKNGDILLAELLRLERECNANLDFSENTIEELKTRLKIYKEIEKDYTERLSIMSSPYYALLQQADFEKAMTAKGNDALLALKQGKDIPGTMKKKQVPAEFTKYMGNIILKKQRWDETKVSDYFTRHSNIESDIKRSLEKKGIRSPERNDRLIREERELRTALVADVTEYRQQALEDSLSKAIAGEEPPQVERQNIDNSMRAVQGRTFVPVEKPSTRMGILGTLKNYGMVGARWILGATIGAVSSVVGKVLAIPGQVAESERVENSQKKRIHGIVPGTKDEKFADEHLTGSDDDPEIMYDIRRAPLVWEKLSAGDPDSPPEVSIMVAQSKRGERVTDVKMVGHAMIGLSYSRFNKATGRKERYKLKMGFYPGSGVRIPGKMVMAAGAMMHGSLENDEKHYYDISRKYTVKPGDINRILRAAETYADGGYGYYKRNCTTFVVDMAKLANLPIANETDVENIAFTGAVSNVADVFAGGSYAVNPLAANVISEKLTRNDLSYKYFGQKMTTKDDLDRFYDQANKGESIRKGYSPGALGEDLLETKTGELGSYLRDLKYDPSQENDLQRIQVQHSNIGDQLGDEIARLLQEQNLERTQEDEEIYLILNTAIPLINATDPEAEDPVGVIKSTHKDVSNAMKRVGKYYETRLKKDFRLNELVMKYLSLCEVSLGILDNQYAKVLPEQYTGDLARMYEDFDKELQLTYKDEQGNSETVRVRPSIYQAFLKMGKTGDQIIKEGIELQRLKEIDDDEKTDQQLSRQRNLEMTIDTAEEFAYANRFALYKDEFSQKDIDYAFSELPKQEARTRNGGMLRGEFMILGRPSFSLQSAILGKILDGMSALGLVDKTMDDRLQVMDVYIADKMNANPEMMQKILSAYIKDKEGSSDKLAADFMGGGLLAYISFVLFGQDMSESQVYNTGERIPGMDRTLNNIKKTIDGLKGNAQA